MISIKQIANSSLLIHPQIYYPTKCVSYISMYDSKQRLRLTIAKAIRTFIKIAPGTKMDEEIVAVTVVGAVAAAWTTHA